MKTARESLEETKKNIYNTFKEVLEEANQHITEAVCHGKDKVCYTPKKSLSKEALGYLENVLKEKGYKFTFRYSQREGQDIFIEWSEISTW